MKSFGGRWGNRLALRIPRDIAPRTRLTAEVDVELVTKADRFFVRWSAPHCDLSGRLAGLRPSNRPEEIAMGPALGEEL